MNEIVLQELLEINENEGTCSESTFENLIDDYQNNVKIVGIIGCGAIASIITDYAAKGKLDIDLKFFYDLDMKRAKKLASKVDGITVSDIKNMIGNVYIVIEAASPQAVVETVPKILKEGKDILIMSLGALMDPIFKNHIEEIAKRTNSRIYMPSGAIAGLDGIKATSMGKIKKVSLITRKHPNSLGISIDEKIVLYEGKASDAVRKFPMNINVAAALSIACNKEADVKIIADPTIDRNCHEIHVIGDFGEIRTITQSTSCTTNLKTSVLAAYSAIKLLNSLNDNIRIGT